MNTGLAIDEWRVECESLAHIFDFAASFYLREPTVERLNECQSVGDALKVHLPDEVFPRFLVESKEEDVSAIKQELFDLFFVPVSGTYCSPYETLQGKNDRKNDAEGSVRRIFAATGFDPQFLAEIPSYLRHLNRPDYMGFELSFIANIFGSAAKESDYGIAQELIETGLLFHEKHYSVWSAAFGNKVHRVAKSNYFMACGAITAYLAGILDTATDEN